jgi:hypothetical protein
MSPRPFCPETHSTKPACKTSNSWRTFIIVAFADHPGNISATSDQWKTSVTAQHAPARRLVDGRLGKLEMKNWSQVCITNERAAHIMSLYIETDYQTLPLFNLDLFLQDVVYSRHNFCSPLLVNAIFAWACVSAVKDLSAMTV